MRVVFFNFTDPNYRIYLVDAIDVMLGKINIRITDF